MPTTPTSDPVFRYARTCYRHPAGVVGVALTDWLLGLAWVEATGGGYKLSSTGLVSLYALGARSQPLATHKIYPYCTDLTEKRVHFSGDLGAALTQWMLDRAWVVRRAEGGRVLLVPEAGYAGLTSLGVSLP